MLVDGLLTTHVTTIVVLPDADGGQVDAVEDVISAAGGEVGERVTIESAWSDPEQSEILARVAENIAKGERDEDTYDLAAQVLAEALLTPGGRSVGEPSFDSIGVLGAFEIEGFISADEDEVILADTAIIVGPAGAVQDADLTLDATADSAGRRRCRCGADRTARQRQDDGVVGVLRGSDADGWSRRWTGSTRSTG